MHTYMHTTLLKRPCARRYRLCELEVLLETCIDFWGTKLFEHHPIPQCTAADHCVATLYATHKKSLYKGETLDCCGCRLIKCVTNCCVAQTALQRDQAVCYYAIAASVMSI
jgi:hypothetical protein